METNTRKITNDDAWEERKKEEIWRRKINLDEGVQLGNPTWKSNLGEDETITQKIASDILMVSL